MAASAAALLDELMGRGRNLAPTDQKSEVHWDDPEICKYFLCGFCPHELFVNTRADLGQCPKVHDDILRKEYEQSSRYQKCGYEEDFLRFLQSLIADVEKRIRRGHQRLALNAMQGTLNGNFPGAKEDKSEMLTERINELVNQAEQLGCEGKVEEAQGVMKLCDQLREERRQLEMNPSGPHWAEPEKTLEVCSVCSAFLVVGDAQQRIDEHLYGRQHTGYARIRAYVDEKQKKHREEAEEREAKELKLVKERENREKEREREREERRKKEKEKEDKEREERRREREKKRKDRSRSRSRGRRSRSRDRRDRSRDRKRRSRSRSRHRKHSHSKDRHRSSRSARSRSRSKSRRRSRSRSRGRDRDLKRRTRSRDRDGKRRSRSRDRSSRRKSRSRDRSSRDKGKQSEDRSYKRSRSREKRSRSSEKRSKSREKRSESREKRSKSREKESVSADDLKRDERSHSPEKQYQSTEKESIKVGEDINSSENHSRPHDNGTGAGQVETTDL